MSLENLYLGSMSIGAEGAQALAVALTNMDRLEVLDLKDNNLGPLAQRAWDQLSEASQACRSSI